MAPVVGVNHVPTTAFATTEASTVSTCFIIDTCSVIAVYSAQCTECSLCSGIAIFLAVYSKSHSSYSGCFYHKIGASGYVLLGIIYFVSVQWSRTRMALRSTQIQREVGRKNKNLDHKKLNIIS